MINGIASDAGFKPKETTGRICVFLMETVKSEDGQIIPCIAVEGETGYYRTDWKWGSDYNVAQQWADQYNARLGLTPRDALLIQISTMRRED